MAKITRKPLPKSRATVPNATAGKRRGSGGSATKAEKISQQGRGRSRGTRAPATKKTKPWTEAEVREAFSRFRKANPEPKGELEHLNPYTLLVAVVLSAQATDAGVNKATRALFAGRRHAAEDARARRGEAARLHQDHRALPHQGEERHRAVGKADRRVRRRGAERAAPELESLPGVGRKTANVVLNMAFGEHTMAVDTHVFRVGNRTGLAPGKTPLEVELD